MDDNPAVTVPASHQQVGPHHHGHQTSSLGRIMTTDPSGEQATIEKVPTTTSLKNERGWRRIVRNLSPSWFSVTMGTGVVSLILYSIPWKADWLYYLSLIFFILNVCLFLAAFTISTLRYSIWPEIWVVMIEDATNSLFLGTVPMGFATIVEMWILVCIPAWESWAVHVGWAMWILDSIVAIAVTVSLPVLLMSASHQRSLDTITAAQLLPIAATIVAANVGSDMADALPNPQQALATLLVSYIMWGMAVPMAFSVLVIYYQRLALHKMPPREIIVSAFLPLGPLGLGGRTILNLGRVCRDVFPQTSSIDPLAGQVAYVVGFFISLIMWAWGLLWFAFALASIYKARPFPFNMGWWGFTFPLGVYSLSTILIGEELPSLFFRVLGTILGVAVILLWILISARTAQGAWRGHLFSAPCLAKLKKPPQGIDQGDHAEQEQQLGSSRSTSKEDGMSFRNGAADFDTGK